MSESLLGTQPSRLDKYYFGGSGSYLICEDKV